MFRNKPIFCRLFTLSCVALAPLPISVAASEQPMERPVVATAEGEVRGNQQGALWVFKGIPYASPPVGDLRWQPPMPAKARDTVLDAGKYGNDCMQTRASWDAKRANEPMGEDCLYLNVWAPAKSDKGDLPVMVWIHGGNYIAGSGSQAIYDGSRLAERGVIIVTINYRLGRFGFFAHPALTKEAGGAPVGNYGIMDQIAALQWVKRNIRAFGGNPDKVTIFGESAGGGSVNFLMLSKSARGLFHGAIVQSGGGRERIPLLDRDYGDKKSAESLGVAFASHQGIENADAATLRAIPAAKVRGNMSLLHMERDSYSGPLIDGQIIAENVDEGFAARRSAPVPYLAGANSYEVGYLPALFRGAATAAIIKDAAIDPASLKAAYGDSAAFSKNAAGDILFLEAARFLAANATAPSYLYRFDYQAEMQRKKLSGVPHTGELPFIFGNLEELNLPITAADRVMAKDMGDRWTQFAKTGEPNSAGAVAWPQYSHDHDVALNFSAAGAAVRSAGSAAVDVIATNYLKRASQKIVGQTK